MAEKQATASAKSYHHGDLPNALRGAALELIGEVGPTAFSLREVARRAGVSHAAPAHHFGDKSGLLTSIAIEGFELLTGEMSAVVAANPDPVERFIAQGLAYVRMAHAHPAHFAVMWRSDLHDDDDGSLDESGLRSFACLVETIEAIAAAHDPTMDVHAAAMMGWSLVQGLSELTEAMDGVVEKFDADAPVAQAAPATAEQLAETVMRLAIRGLVPGYGADDVS